MSGPSPHPLAALARAAIEAFLREGRPLEAPRGPGLDEPCAVFVSLKRGGELRGCIGTLEPTTSRVAEEVVANAVSAATRDPRFPPLAPAELDGLDVSVDVLSPPEPVRDPAELDPRRYGVIVRGRGRRGVLLPDLEGVDTAEQQLAIARRKAGLGPEDEIEVQRFEVRRCR